MKVNFVYKSLFAASGSAAYVIRYTTIAGKPGRRQRLRISKDATKILQREAYTKYSSLHKWGIQ